MRNLSIEEVSSELEFHVNMCLNAGRILENKWLRETVEKIFGENSLLKPVICFLKFKDKVLSERKPEDIETMRDMLDNFGLSGSEILELLEKLKEVDSQE